MQVSRRIWGAHLRIASCASITARCGPPCIVRKAGLVRLPCSASQLLREGASLIDISQVLRHKHLESTAIYAKVDLGRLRQAAGSWPGAAR
jgi:site-specific recombinase XerD